MRTEYDFPKGERGKFYRKDAVISFPLFLEPDVSEFITKLAEEKGIDLQQLINEWLRANIQLLKSVEQVN
jgi:hypothetical protein